MAEAQPSRLAGSPYAVAAAAYWKKGWAPIPVPYGSKRITESGYTGYKGAYPNAAEVKAWMQAEEPSNIAVRMPSDVIGIDVDAYGAKHGDMTLDLAEAQCGPLPATWRSGSREEPSGIYWFRVPADLAWHDLGEHVETISWHHRYAVVWPSVHPDTGQTYGWFDERGTRVLEPPAKEALAELPAVWVKRLLKGDRAETHVPASTGPQRPPEHGVRADAARWIESSLDRLRALGEEPWYEGAMWDQTTFNVACDLIRLANSGWSGYRLEDAEADLREYAPSDEVWGSYEHDVKWRSALAAVGDEARPDPLLDVFDVVTPEESGGSLFDASPVLQHIRQAAHSRGLKAPLVLVNVLGRILLEIPPNWMLPATVGARASLNLGFATVGVSSAGKSASLQVSEELLGMTGLEQRQGKVRGVGSGEGIIETYLDMGNKINGIAQPVPDPARMFVADEIETFGKMIERSGSTLSGFLKTALTGGQLDTTNAAQGGRNRLLPAGIYRMVVVVGIQPLLADYLLSGESSGLPQRFLWCDESDAEAPRTRAEIPEWPGELDWSLPGDRMRAHTFTYPEHITEQVIQAHLDEQHRTDGDKSSGHLNLTRLKVAVALAVLHGDVEITDQWWDLAGRFTKESVRVIARCRADIEASKARTKVAQAKEAGQMQNITAEAADHDRQTLVATKERILALLADEPMTGGALTTRVTKRQRPYAERALVALETEGKVVIEEVSYRGQVGRRVRLA